MRVIDELRGNEASFWEAANRSSIGFFLSAMMAFKGSRLAFAFCAIFRRRLFFSIELFFAMRLSRGSAFESVSQPSLPEREIECGQQRARLLVVRRRRADRDVHAPGLARLVEVDFREHDVLLQAERIV